MNPYVLLAALVLIVGSVVGAGWKGYQIGRDAVIAEQAKVDLAYRTARDAAATAAAEAISKLELKQVNITQRVERETIERPVYRDCQHTPDGLQLLNEALAPGRNGQQGAGSPAVP